MTLPKVNVLYEDATEDPGQNGNFTLQSPALIDSEENSSQKQDVIERMETGEFPTEATLMSQQRRTSSLQTGLLSGRVRQDTEEDTHFRRISVFETIDGIEFASMQNEQSNMASVERSILRRKPNSPRSQADLQNDRNFGKLQGSRAGQLNLQSRDVDTYSQQSFFSRVIEDIHSYRNGTLHQFEENLGASQVQSKLNESRDDNYQLEGSQTAGALPVAISSYTLKSWDFYLYIIGMLVRIQTIVLGYILFCVETENTCIVVWEANKPIPRTLLPDNLDKLPGGFANMSRIFETIIMMLFITSVCTSIMYINKVVNVIKFHRAPKEIYEESALPAVRKYKIWNTIFGLSHLACCTIFMTHAGRVCSGWQVGNLSPDEKENLDRSLYLFARGGYFVVASIFGMCNLIGFLIVGKNAIN